MSGGEDTDLRPMQIGAEMGSSVRPADEPLQPMKVASNRLRNSSAAVDTLRADVAAGRVKLDPAAGREVQELLADQRDEVDAWLRRSEDLGRRAPLGRNPVGEAMAGKFSDRTINDGDSFTGVLTRYREVLDEAHDAVTEAMRRYRDVDEHAENMFQNIKSDL